MLSSKCVPVKNCSGMWATVLAMIALKENLAVLLLSVVPVAPVHRAVPRCKSYSECPQQGPQPERDSNGKYFSEKTRIGLYGYEEERRRRKTWLTWKTPSAGFLLSCRETNVAASWEGEMGRFTSRHGCHWLCYGKARQPL